MPVSTSVLVARSQFNIISVRRLTGKLAVHTELSLRQPAADPDDTPNKAENDNYSDQYAENVPRNNAPSANIIVVEEVIDIETLCRGREVGQAEVKSEDEDQPHDMNPRRRVCSRDKYFEKSE